MAAGARIDGTGDVAWTFSCTNDDQLSICTKCYYVPSVTVLLLSLQKLFDEQNAQSGKYWGDEEMFHMDYDKQPSIDVRTVPYLTPLKVILQLDMLSLLLMHHTLVLIDATV